MSNKNKLVLLGIAILGLALIIGGCGSTGNGDPEGGISGTGASIDCEQEANKYRKPCRSKRW